MYMTVQQGGEWGMKQVLEVLLAEQNIWGWVFLKRICEKMKKGIRNIKYRRMLSFLMTGVCWGMDFENGGRSLFLSGFVLLFLLKYCYELSDSGNFVASTEPGIL